MVQKTRRLQGALCRIEWEGYRALARPESSPKGLSHTAHGRMIPASLCKPPAPTIHAQWRQLGDPVSVRGSHQPVACPCERPSIGRRVWQEKAKTAIPQRARANIAEAIAPSKVVQFRSELRLARAFHSLSRSREARHIIIRLRDGLKGWQPFVLLHLRMAPWMAPRVQCHGSQLGSLERSRDRRRLSQVMRYDAVGKESKITPGLPALEGVCRVSSCRGGSLGYDDRRSSGSSRRG